MFVSCVCVVLDLNLQMMRMKLFRALFAASLYRLFPYPNFHRLVPVFEAIVSKAPFAARLSEGYSD